MIDIAIQAAREAGKILLQHMGNIQHIEIKDGQELNLVTEADKESERRIIEIISAKYPDHSFLAEEGGSVRTASDYRWIIDPLDGTTNYAHGLPLFSVSIGLECRGDLVAGVVYNPVLNEMFTAEAGGGAYLNGNRITVSATSELSRSLLVTGFPYNVKSNPDHMVERFQAFLMSARGIRRLGSAALDCAFVACGRFDGFWEVWLNPWDLAAGAVLVREAGGRTSDFEGNPHRLDVPQWVASNGLIHDQMLEVLRRAAQ